MGTNTANRNSFTLATLLVALTLALAAAFIAAAPSTAHAAKLGSKNWSYISEYSDTFERSAGYVGDDVYTLDKGIVNGVRKYPHRILKNGEELLTLPKYSDLSYRFTNGDYLLYVEHVDGKKKMNVYLYNLKDKSKKKLYVLKAWGIVGAYVYNDALYYSVHDYGGFTGPSKIWKIALKKGAKSKLISTKNSIGSFCWGVGKYVMTHSKQFGKTCYIMDVTTKKRVKTALVAEAKTAGHTDKYWYYATEKKIDSSYKYITWYRLNANGKGKKTLGSVKVKKNMETMYVSGWEGVYGKETDTSCTAYHYNFATKAIEKEDDGFGNDRKRVTDRDPEEVWREKEATAETVAEG